MNVRIGKTQYTDCFPRLDETALRNVSMSADVRRRIVTERARPYRPAHPVALEVEQIGGGMMRHIVRPIDITARGLGCLIGPYVHESCSGVVHLALPDGKYQTVCCVSTGCQYVGARVHMLTLAFEDPVDTDLITGVAAGQGGGGAPAEATTGALCDFIGASEELVARYGEEDLAVILESMAASIRGNVGVLLPEELETPDRIAIITPGGEIRGVNPAWINFSLEAGHTGGSFVGTDYLGPLRMGVGEHVGLKRLIEGLERVSKDEIPEYRYVYDCANARGETEWFCVRHATALRDGADCVIVRHMGVDPPDEVDPSSDAG